MRHSDIIGDYLSVLVNVRNNRLDFDIDYNKGEFRVYSKEKFLYSSTSIVLVNAWLDGWLEGKNNA